MKNNKALSRSEKFLYALYYSDISDLPNPLSRIEELYNCLAAGGELPTFEPLSRSEKYIMVILGVYDLNNLPNPLSRSEVLLYKLAVGDSNLDDVGSAKSSYESLLMDIIRTGGIGESEIQSILMITKNNEYIVDKNGNYIEFGKIRNKK